MNVASKQLREAFSEIMFLKLGIDMARTDTQYPLLPMKDRDEALKQFVEVATAYTAKQTDQVLERLEITIDDGKNSHSMAVIRAIITAERNRLTK